MNSNHNVVQKPFYLFNMIPSFALVFFIGASCMVVAGFFLIEGLSQFSGGHTAKTMLIVGGVLFQITESSCFILAATTRRAWRIGLLALGVVLFSFSIGVMTLAQKTALQTGEAQASAIDEKRESIRAQIASLDEVIASYRHNAEKQSQSIYKDSRALGQDSLNRATSLEERKINLSAELFTLNEARRQTSSDFFNRLGEVTGLPAKPTEFYFLVVRSLLLELCGVFFMAFGASRRVFFLGQQPIISARTAKTHEFLNKDKPGGEGDSLTFDNDPAIKTVRPTSITRDDALSDPTNLPLPGPSDVFVEPEYFEVPQKSAAVSGASTAYSNVRYLKSASMPATMEKIEDDKVVVKKYELDDYVNMVIALKTAKKIQSFGQRAIRNALAKHHDIKIGTDKARDISMAVKTWLD